jgi:hypothetical protein
MGVGVGVFGKGKRIEMIPFNVHCCACWVETCECGDVLMSMYV